MADIKIVGGRGVGGSGGGGGGGEDNCDCHVDHKTIGGKGSKKHPFRSIALPGAQAFATTTKVIYARPKGNDKGNGTIEDPLATFQEAVRRVPLILQPGATFILDITGINELLPDDYTLPAWKAPGIANFNVPEPYATFVFTLNPVSIIAIPQPVPSLGADAVINLADIQTIGGPITTATNTAPIQITAATPLADGDSVTIFGVNGNDAANGTWFVTNVVPGVSFTLDGSDGTLSGVYAGGGTIYNIAADPITTLLTYTLVSPRSSWVAGPTVVGKQIYLSPTGPSGVGGSGVIDSVDPTGQIFTSTNAAPFIVASPDDFPLTVSEPSATLHGAGFTYGTLNVFNVDSLGINGVRVVSDVGNYGLFTDGVGSTSVCGCELPAAFIATTAKGIVFDTVNRLITSWFSGPSSFVGASFFASSFLDATDESFGIPTLPSPNIPVLVSSVLRGCAPLRVESYTPGTGVFNAASVLHFRMHTTLVSGSTGDGVQFYGNTGFFDNVDFSGCLGNGVTVEEGGGVLRLFDCGSSVPNGNFGVEISDGMQVIADVDTTTTQPLAGRPLTGSLGGDIQLGSVGPTGWGAVAVPPNNVADFAGISATGSRISQQ